LYWAATLGFLKIAFSLELQATSIAVVPNGKKPSLQVRRERTDGTGYVCDGPS
jgi:hypothetical protein